MKLSNGGARGNLKRLSLREMSQTIPGSVGHAITSNQLTSIVAEQLASYDGFRPVDLAFALRVFVFAVGFI